MRRNHRNITYPDRHQPVFFYLKFRKVNSKAFTAHGPLTIYHIEIKDKIMACEQFSVKKVFSLPGLDFITDPMPKHTPCSLPIAIY
ncbi:hypothetical protein EWK22_15495 [Salmonella enterica subsp. enterica serovar Redba]|nr:hypothetical protein [Salmonella enterica subsp. enterica serovar Redba]